ncbi:MAG: radical SAM protein [Desulfovibrionaceae bacterium]
MNDFLIKYESAHHEQQPHSFPCTLLLSPSQKCNFRCRTCVQRHTSEELPPETLKKLEAILPYVIWVDFVGGEPLLLDSFDQVIDWGSKYGCKLETVTNGVLLNDRWRERIVENMTNIRISVDGATQKTYEYVRRYPNLKKVLSNIAKLALLKVQRGSTTPIIEINFVAMKANIKELPALTVMAADLGVQAIRVIYMMAHNEELAKQSLYFCQEQSDAYMAKAVAMGEKVGVEVKVPGLFRDTDETAQGEPQSSCAGPWHFLGVEHNGDAKICCGGAPPFGNLNTMSFREFWSNKKLRNLRRVINTPDQPTYCKNCYHGGHNLKRRGKHIPREADYRAAATALGVAEPVEESAHAAAI